MKSLPGTGATSRQLRDGGVGAREQQQDLGLERVGVLELVDEDVREAALKLGAHLGAVADEVARAQQEVEEVERSPRAS